MVKTLSERLGEDQCSILFQDSYYWGAKYSSNYDHPEAIDFQLMQQHLALLKQGQPIEMPVYDFVHHARTEQTTVLKPKPIILVDGILILHADSLRNSFDLKIFVECEEEVRRQRRLHRDIAERGRTYENTLKQFDFEVVPAHNKFVEPSKIHADKICVDSVDFNHLFLDQIFQHCQQYIVI